MQDIILFAQHHALLCAIFIIALALLLIIELIKLKNSAQRISPAVATQLMNHKNAIVLDIRNTEAFATGHIIDAISIPLLELENKYSKLNKFKLQPIVISCATGLESPRAARFLTKNGFNAFILAGGVRGWKEAEMPLIKGTSK